MGDNAFIRNKARMLCADEAKRVGLENWHVFLKGDFDHSPWMQIASKALLAGIDLERKSHAD
jgi:hypothetical protein